MAEVHGGGYEEPPALTLNNQVISLLHRVQGAGFSMEGVGFSMEGVRFTV